MDYRKIGIRVYQILGCTRHFSRTGLVIIGLIFPVACFSQINSSRPGTILWEVSPRGNETLKSYILGTEHLYPGSLIDTIKEIKQGILTADYVAGEGNIPEREPIGFNSATEKIPYKELMDDEDYSMVDRYLTEHGFRSLEEMDSARYPIGKLANYVFRDAGTQAFDLDPQNEPSMDANVQKLARSHKIPYHALDSGLSINDSVLAFGNSEFEFADFLVNFVKLSKDSLRARYGLIQKMASFDINYKFDEKSPQLDNNGIRYLLFVRNKYWLPKLEMILKEHKCFIAVGLDHLKYQSGLLWSLQSSGFIVKPVRIKSEQ